MIGVDATYFGLIELRGKAHEGDAKQHEVVRVWAARCPQLKANSNPGGLFVLAALW